jgi:hypothetical protein
MMKISNLKSFRKAASLLSVFWISLPLSACGKSNAPQVSNAAPPPFQEQTVKLNISGACDIKRTVLPMCMVLDVVKDLPSRTQGFDAYPIHKIDSVSDGYVAIFTRGNQAMNFTYEIEKPNQKTITLVNLKKSFSKTSEIEQRFDIINQKYSPDEEFVNEKKVAQRGVGKKHPCKVGAFNQSLCMINAILADRLEQDPLLFGGEILEILRVSENSYIISISRNEGVDLYKYEFNLSNDAVQLKSRSYAITGTVPY